jgi:hypothetical protein
MILQRRLIGWLVDNIRKDVGWLVDNIMKDVGWLVDNIRKDVGWLVDNIRKDVIAVVAEFPMLSQDLPGGTEGRKKYPVSGPRFEPGASWILVTQLTKTFSIYCCDSRELESPESIELSTTYPVTHAPVGSTDQPIMH